MCGFSSIILLQTRQKYAGGLSPGKCFSRSMQQNLPKRHLYTLVKTGSKYSFRKKALHMKRNGLPRNACGKPFLFMVLYRVRAHVHRRLSTSFRLTLSLHEMPSCPDIPQSRPVLLRFSAADYTLQHVRFCWERLS